MHLVYMMPFAWDAIAWRRANSVRTIFPVLIYVTRGAYILYSCTLIVTGCGIPIYSNTFTLYVQIHQAIYGPLFWHYYFYHIGLCIKLCMCVSAYVLMRNYNFFACVIQFGLSKHCQLCAFYFTFYENVHLCKLIIRKRGMHYMMCILYMMLAPYMIVIC